MKRELYKQIAVSLRALEHVRKTEKKDWLDFWEGKLKEYENSLPNFVNDFSMRLVGKNRNDIKNYLYDTFDYALRQLVD